MVNLLRRQHNTRTASVYYALLHWEAMKNTVLYSPQYIRKHQCEQTMQTPKQETNRNWVSKMPGQVKQEEMRNSLGDYNETGWER